MARRLTGRRRRRKVVAAPVKAALRWKRQLGVERRRELAGLALIVLAGLVALALFTPASGWFGTRLGVGLRGLLGRAAFLVPLILGTWGLAAAAGWKRGLSLPARTGAVLGLVSFCGLFDAVFPQAPGEPSAGGLVGQAVAGALTGAFGGSGKDLLLAGMAVVSVILFANVSVVRVARGFLRGFKRTGLALTAGAGRSKGGRPVREAPPVGPVADASVDAPVDARIGAVIPPYPGYPDDPVAVDAVDAAAAAVAADIEGPLQTVDRLQVGEEEPAESPAEFAAAKPSSFRQIPLNDGGIYQLPPLTLLGAQSGRGRFGEGDDVQGKRRILEETLRSFGVEARILAVEQGPAVTRFEVQPAPGVKVSRISRLSDDIALSLAAPGVRIVTPIPGKAALGIEVPNREVSIVYLRDVIESREFRDSPYRLTVALGQDISGRPVVSSLERMVHLLVAGATGSGKSVFINALLCSLLFKATPAQLRLLLIDPKVVELSSFNGIPHLITPVVTDPKRAAACLRWVLKEMGGRYESFANTGVRDIDRYNQWALAEGEPPLPYIVVIIDELADLMMVAPTEVEDAIQRLAQMARAAGIHLVVATQRPSVDVITGVIKANIASRIAFAVSSQVDSRTILDSAGAEKLVGHGDMLFHPMGASKPVRVQGPYIPEHEMEGVLAFIRRQASPQHQPGPLDVEVAAGGGAEEFGDKLFPDAVRVVVETGQASVSIVQRRLRVGYTRAGRLIDMMEERGIIGPHQGPKPREVLIGLAEYRRLFDGGVGASGVGGAGGERRDESTSA